MAHGPGTAMGGLSDCSSRWISQRLPGSATGHFPMRIRRLRASQRGHLEPPADIKLEPSWNPNDRDFLDKIQVLPLDVHPFHGSNV